MSAGFHQAPRGMIDKAVMIADHARLDAFLAGFKGGGRMDLIASEAQIDLERALYLSHIFLAEGIFEEFRPVGHDPSGGQRIFALTAIGFDFQLLLDMHGAVAAGQPTAINAAAPVGEAV